MCDEQARAHAEATRRLEAAITANRAAVADAAGAPLDEGERLRTSEWVERYPLGPLSTGLGFVNDGISTWRRWAAERSMPRTPGPLRMAVHTLDGAIDCVSRVMIVRAVQTAAVDACNQAPRSARAVVMRAVINGDGWIAPIEASVDRRDVALAQCVATAIHRPAGLPHDERAGVETVVVVQWGDGGSGW